MSLMTREDVLRELELLPVWQLKAPLPSVQAIPITVEPAPADAIESTPLLSTVIEQVPLEGVHEEPAVKSTVVTAPFRLLISADASMGFVLDCTSSNAQDIETLLSNMLKAININCSIDIAEASAETLGEHAIKLLLVMGEAAAHSLLGQLQGMEDWRSAQAASPIYYQHLPVVITYHPAFLLKNTAYKAQAWVDLCAAKRILQGL
ncbi:hypothetical protein [Methylotenera mobilis]|uniref:Uracil-DNA glycosylase-like domain-containing protein n=1 Tax=Methylotenera mobilis (strain JLW8 / ATCC BAA-1282 / DSM 17540) TaxID=583345 RepID=C6WTW1_METML|nr:hypothetical protein [Methylotenera mobilis]ACT47360.1 hypothetical protein Mmol_0450 [Methylotenera mobilis JLW8]